MLHVEDAHSEQIGALAVLEHDGEPLIISAGIDGALRSWRGDGTRSVLHVDDAHSGWIGALAVIEHDNAPLPMCPGGDWALRSWRADGTPGALYVDDAHSDWIAALAVVEHDCEPLIISAGHDRTIISSPIAAGHRSASPSQLRARANSGSNYGCGQHRETRTQGRMKCAAAVCAATE